MVKKANTAEDKDRCREYLRQYELESPTDCFLYIESPAGKITAVAGITIGICDSYKMGYVEPYYADNNITNLKLYCAAEGYLLANGCRYSVVGCEVNKNTENMYGELGYKQWSKNMNQYIKTL
jgi:hypothetical protein